MMEFTFNLQYIEFFLNRLNQVIQICVPTIVGGGTHPLILFNIEIGVLFDVVEAESHGVAIVVESIQRGIVEVESVDGVLHKKAPSFVGD